MGDLMDVLLGGDAGSDVEELADAGLAGEVADGAAEVGPVGARDRPDIGLHGDERAGGVLVHAEVMLPAQPPVVDPGDARLAGVDPRRDPAFFSGHQGLPSRSRRALLMVIADRAPSGHRSRAGCEDGTVTVDGTVKPVKHSVAVVVRGPGGTFLVVKRPDDPGDLLAGVWGLPAVTRHDGEDERSAAARAGRAKLGVELAVGHKIGERTADRGTYVLTLSDYEATVVSGTVTVPQPDASVTQYTEARFTGDPGVLQEAAGKGSVCAQIFLESGSPEADFLESGSPEADFLESGSLEEPARVAAFRERLGLSSLIDAHTHFMPERLLAAVWKYFDEQGPLVGRPWPIRYRMAERARVETLRSFGVRAFTSMLYPHKPGMARSLNDWAADFAARTPDCLQTATFFAEPAAAGDVRHALDQGARVFKCHLQVGQFDPNDPVLDDAWDVLAEAGVPVVTHCGSGPVPGKYTGPEPIAALLARRPRLRLVVAHLGMPEYREFLDLAERYDRVMLDTTMAFTAFAEEDAPFPRGDLPRLEALGDRVLLGTDFPNIPYSYADALEAPERAGLSRDWLRAVCHDNAAALFGL
jgi:uncharacterized protein